MEASRQEDTAGEPSYPSTLYAWYCVFILVGIYLNSFLDRQILALLVGPIRQTMHLSDTQVGFLMGPAFAIFYTIAGLPLGWLADRMSRRVLIAIGQIFWSMASVAFGLGKNYLHLSIARIGVGVGEASLSPSAYSLITDLFRPHMLARALSVYGMGIFLGGGLANLLGGTAIRALDAQSTEPRTLALVGEVFPWQIIFLLIAAPTIPLTLLLLTVKEPARRGFGKVRDAEGNVRPLRVPMSMFGGYVRKNLGTILCHNFGFSFLAFSGYGAAAWLPAYFVRLHEWDRGFVGQMLGINGIIAGPLGIVFGGWLADRLMAAGSRDAKVRVGLISCIAWLPFGVAVPLMPTGWLAFSMVVPSTFIGAMCWGIAPAAIQEIVPNQMRGQASAVYLFVINLVGLGLGPYLLALVTDYVFQDDMQVHYSLLITTVVAHFASAVLLFLALPRFRASRQYLERWLAEPS